MIDLRKFLDCTLLAGAIAGSRYLCRSRCLYDIDSVNFALGMEHFDPSLHQPHPPGYFLYVYAARAINMLCQDANTSMVALSIAAACAAGLLIYLLTHNWFGRRAALFAGAIFLFSPLCWFHGTVALTYIVEMFFSGLVGYLCWHAYTGEGLMLLPAAAALGIAAGFRPSSMLFLGPLWLLSLYRARVWIKAGAALLLSLTVLAWGVPMVHAAGGLHAYVSALTALWNLVPGKQSFKTVFFIMSFARAATILGIGALCFGCASLLILRPSHPADSLGRDKKVFIWTWMGPGLLFFTFVFLNFVNSGYLLVLSPPAFAWLGHRASLWYTQYRRGRRLRATLIAGAALANTAVFLFAPFYCSFREVRNFEAQLTDTVASLRRRFDPEQTLIVGFDSHFLGYRHAAYYLPEFLTVQYPAVPLRSGPRIFAVRGHRTELLSAVPASRFRQFVLFPLPSGREYKDYVDLQKARFPAGLLHTAVGKPEFVTGTASDLGYLFHGALSRAIGCIRCITTAAMPVYWRSHQAAAS